MCNKSTPKPTKLKHMRTASSCTVASLFLQQILAEAEKKDNSFDMEEAPEAHSMSCLCL